MTTLIIEPVWIKKKKKETKKKDKDILTTWSVGLDMKYKVRISSKTPSTLINEAP